MYMETISVLSVISTIAAVICAYIFIMPRSKAASLKGFPRFLHEFFNFRKLYIESVVRFFYVATTIGCICTGFFMLFGYRGLTAIPGLFLMIFGIVGVRLIFELQMLLILLVKNVIEINAKINDKPESIDFAAQGAGTMNLAGKVAEAVKKAAAGSGFSTEDNGQNNAE